MHVNARVHEHHVLRDFKTYRWKSRKPVRNLLETPP